MAAHKVTDQQIIEDWSSCPSITELAARYGMAHRTLANRVKRLRKAGHSLDSPDRRSPNFAVDATKILLLDIETAPMIAMVWGTRKQYINHDWIAQNGYILCWTAKWLGSKEVMFKRIRKGQSASLLGPIQKLLHQAHAVIHYNGKKFDIPTLNKEFLTHGIPPPSPYKQVDLLQTMWEKFSFPSNKLDYIAQTLGLGKKMRHEGPQLWKDCMDDRPQAWKTMEAYNRQDVVLLEKLYLKLRPWIKGHPNIGAIAGVPACPNCGSEDFKRDQTHLAQVLKYERYQCASCHTWFRGTKSINPRKEKRFVGIA